MKLSYTSAYVLLLFDRSIYKSDAAKHYLDALDLSAGRPLYEKTIARYPVYRQVITNRKFAILTLCEQLNEASILPQQIALAGAGLDALGIELAARYPVIPFELDIDHMAEKQALLDKLGISTNCHFITADLTTATDCLKALQHHGWQMDKPGLLIFEGISYYISAAALSDLCRTIKTDKVIVEYLRPLDTLSPLAQEISGYVFGEIAGDAFSQLQRYTASLLEKQIEKPARISLSMMDLEKLRSGQNHYFRKPPDGWIETSLFATAPINLPHFLASSGDIG